MQVMHLITINLQMASMSKCTWGQQVHGKNYWDSYTPVVAWPNYIAMEIKTNQLYNGLSTGTNSDTALREHTQGMIQNTKG